MSAPSPPGGWDRPGDAPGDGRDPWSGPPTAPPPSAEQVWWRPEGPPPGHDAFPPHAPVDPGTAPGPGGHRRAGAPARRIVVGSGVLLLGVVGGFAGGLLQDEVGDSDGTYPAVAIASPSAGSTERPAGSVAGIAAAALPSVVALQVQGQEGTGTGSGFVLDTSAGGGGTFVLTNNHVVAGAYDDGVTVVFQDGAQAVGELVGADASYDLAVVRVERGGLRALPFGDSAAVVVGDPVVAVGAPLGLQGTVTEGIVSALNRPVSAGESGPDASYIQAIQTDAAINPGNSGGPLLNAAGEVIGINSAIAALPGAGGGQTTGSIGLGFSIPSEQARRTAEQLIRTGRAVHPIIGVSLDSSYTGEGVQILDSPGAVNPGGPGERAGLQPGDVVLAIDGRPVTEPAELIVDIRAREPGEQVTLTVRRDGRTTEVPVTLEADG
ncbi:S1C family serine protease [Kineococcus radiotolerans]|uniref:Peptidase S1 and S6 chymotrypsin/Hap n=1 Tax=Kineococcus radiotolerans (strain ATCC BAA-149 / DSM 14245 / SRS30216) TaxID=266940 RepID=A6W752_KINRD|nr:trypsin-like peptidase domain-containing protein [Kineococcus radiotolerans]ABS02641.1 peptidase S1 and S6 chymotrypsin/Hap [Kineococcus radiotolerans SRS30216 = ATCC BAA-149]